MSKIISVSEQLLEFIHFSFISVSEIRTASIFTTIWSTLVGSTYISRHLQSSSLVQYRNTTASIRSRCHHYFSAGSTALRPLLLLRRTLSTNLLSSSILLLSHPPPYCTTMDETRSSKRAKVSSDAAVVQSQRSTQFYHGDHVEIDLAFFEKHESVYGAKGEPGTSRFCIYPVSKDDTSLETRQATRRKSFLSPCRFSPSYVARAESSNIVHKAHLSHLAICVLSRAHRIMG